MKKRWYVLLGASVPLALGLLAFQSFRYRQGLRELERLEREQRQAVALSARALVGVGMLESPERIKRIAERDLGLSIDPSKPAIIIKKGGEGEGGDE